jgi:cation:H+ antiporter
MSLVIGVAAFGAGTWLLVESVESLVKAVRAWALAAGLSGIVLSALVLGFDVESTAAGVAATLEGLPGTALGASFGAAILLVTLGLGLAALVAPFTVHPPRAMLASAAVAALLPAGLALDGTMTRVDGAILLAAFMPLVIVLLRLLRAPGGAAPAATTIPGEPPSRPVLRAFAALAGLLVGAEALVWGTQRTVSELGISETVFGLLIVAAAVSVEELVLEMLPAYRGFPELSVGNALGTLVFLLTGSLGVIALARPVEIPEAVRDFHVPALLVTTALALTILARGRLGRPEGVVLVGAYAAYVAGALVAGG